MNKIFGGRYEVLEQIGSGGMAIVYKAKDALLNRIVTIKVLREQFVSDEDFIRRFRREAQAAASLSHPNIVSIYDVGKDGDAEYIVMEYVEGRNLKEIIREYAPISQEQALYLAKQIGEAIFHAHAHNIIHRDIKPHNILITSDGRAKVTDFGIARAVSSATVTHTGNIVGSVHYLSPEQAKGIQSNEQSDIYSLGIILYELLTGKVPYDGETAIAIALKHLQENAVSPRKLNPRISPELEMVIMRAIAKSPEQRYISAREMLDDLENVRTGQPVSRPNFAVNEELEMTQIHRPLVTSTPLGPQVIPRSTASHGGEAPKQVKAGKLSKKARARIILGSLAAGLLIILIGGGVWFANYIKVEDVMVPDLTNLSIMQATLELEKYNLELNPATPTTEYNSDIAKDLIVSQDPEPQTKVKANRKVIVTLSKGPEQFKFPNLKNGQYNKGTAEDLLKALGYAGDITWDEKPSAAPEGQVVDQDPAPDALWAKNAKATLWLSSGANGQQVNMPNMVSKPGSEAEKELRDTYGLVVTVETADSTLYPKDLVIETRPAPGEPVKKGDTVTLVISRGPGPLAWDSNLIDRIGAMGAVRLADILTLAKLHSI